VECHAEARERRFTRSMVSCGSCHQADYAMTSRPNHGMAGFDSQRCQTCHGPFRFIPAKYAAHDRCFITSRGSHAGLPCTACHGASAFTSTAIGSCLSITGQLQCIECHQKTHECLAMDKRHANIAGYSCTNRKCYECHQPLGGGP
jgi:hypothetical protein